jgi:Zn-dependent peptidase ImmA (M78 family)
LIHDDDPSAIEFSVDPYPMICNNGLQCEERELPANQLGFINLQEKKIVLNSLGKSNAGRYRFTMAHEFGHYILHEYLLKAQGVVSFGDTTDSIMKAPTIKNEDMQWLERQANRFASALLMPEELIRKLYGLLHRTFLGVRYGDTLQPLHYSEEQKETYDPYNQIVKTMAKTLNVSPDAMGIRLKQLGLLDQTRYDSFNQGGPLQLQQHRAPAV